VIPTVLQNPLEERSIRIKTVRRGGASSFLSHDASSGEYQIVKNVISKKDTGTYAVEIVLEDSKHGEKSYNVNFNVNCTIEGNITAFFEVGKVLERKRKTTNPPRPILREVSQTGFVLIEFTHKMLPPKNLTAVTNGTIFIDGVEHPALEVQVLTSDEEVTP